MSRIKTEYKLKSEVWLYPGMAHSTSSGQAGAWHFISVPKKQAAEIKKAYAGKTKGWGSLPVEATVGKTTWKSSIFPDSKSGTYLLPLKAAIRKSEGIYADDTITFTIRILA